ncbi:hypothetical protein [Fervidobacterium gondwanense]|nr:hypothetical protein [Fervidobacterium gondwanense]
MGDFKRRLLLILAVLTLGTIGFLTPYVPLKVVFVFFAIACTGYIVKEYTGKWIEFLILSVLLFLIPMANVETFRYMAETKDSNVFVNTVENIIESFTGSEGSKIYYHPDTKVESRENVVIDVDGGVDIVVGKGNIIEFPSQLKTSVKNGTLEIKGGTKNSIYKVLVGGDMIRSLEISSLSVKLKSELENSLEHLSIDSVDTKLSGSIKSDYAEFDSTGFDLDGNISVNELVINSVGVNINGNVSSNRINIDSVGLNLNIVLSNCSLFEAFTTGANGKITYAGGKNLRLSINSTGGKIIFKNDSDSSVSIQAEGVKVVRE